MMKEKLITELTEIASDLMESVGGEYPSEELPTLDEIHSEMQDTSMPYGDDAMFSVCITNTVRISNILKELIKGN